MALESAGKEVTGNKRLSNQWEVVWILAAGWPLKDSRTEGCERMCILNDHSGRPYEK